MMSSRLPSLHFLTYLWLGSFRYPGNGHFSAGLRLYEDERERLHFRESFLVKYLFQHFRLWLFCSRASAASITTREPIDSSKFLAGQGQLVRQQGIYPLQLLATLVHRLPRFFLPLPL